MTKPSENWDCSYKKTESLSSILPLVEENKKIGIYGGSFNPPHLGHAMMCLAVLMTQDIDEVWVLPTADHADKENLDSMEKRLAMCRHTFDHLAGTRVLPVESFLPKPSYTVNTLRAIKGLRPKAELFFMIGTDLVEDVPKWDNAEGITKYATFLIVPRQGYPLIDIPEELGQPLEVDISIDLPEVSSSFISKLRERGAEVKGFIERKVNAMLG